VLGAKKSHSELQNFKQSDFFIKFTTGSEYAWATEHDCHHKWKRSLGWREGMSKNVYARTPVYRGKPAKTSHKTAGSCVTEKAKEGKLLQLIYRES
jgi:hypothetical protein